MTLPSDLQLSIVDDFDTACELMRWADTRDCADVMGVDTETTGLAKTDTVRLVQIGGRTHGWAMRWDRWSGLFEDIVKRYRGKFVLHNAPFDQSKLARQGVTIPVHQIHDTRPMSHILTPNQSTALKNQAGWYVDADAAAAQATLDNAIGKGGWTWATVPFDFQPYWQYGALDPVLTVHLYDHHYPKVMADAPDAYDLELAVIWVIEQMETYGAHVDVPYTRSKKDDFDHYVERAGAWVKDTYDVSAGSNDAIVELLAREGYDFTKMTAGGKPALDKDVLAGIDHELAQTVLKRRQLQKLSSTYLRHFIEGADANDCIHPSINSLGARTGRMSMSNPNLQNLPRKSERNKAAEVVRNCISARPGHTMLMCDFDQIEMRLLAHLSGDANLCAAFHSEDDFFVGLARQIFQDPSIQKKDARRQITKNAGYSEIYGAGIPKFAMTAGISEDQARLVKNRWNQLYGGTKDFSRRVEQFAWEAQRQTGVPFYRSPVTGRRHVADPNKIYALLNYLIQGSAAEVFKQKLVQLSAIGASDWMVVPVHDEIILDVPNDSVPDAVEMLREVMNDHSGFKVPITASVSHGQRWGAKEDY